jgi:hypothetical protein
VVNAAALYLWTCAVLCRAVLSSRFSDEVVVVWVQLQELIYSAFWAFMMLLSCCLFSDGITYVHNFYENEQNVKGCPYTGWKFGVAVGFIAFFVMLGKCYLTYKELRDSG